MGIPPALDRWIVGRDTQGAGRRMQDPVRTHNRVIDFVSHEESCHHTQQVQSLCSGLHRRTVRHP